MKFEAGEIVYLKNVAGEVMEGRFPQDFGTNPGFGVVDGWVDFFVINRIGGKVYESQAAINMCNIVSIKPK